MSVEIALLLLIQESGLTLRGLARRSGVHINVLSRWKRGKQTLTIRTADRLLKTLHATCELKREKKA